MNTQVTGRRDKCVYVHKLGGEVVYVGSGNHNRFNCKSGRSPEHLKLWESLQKDQIKTNLSILEAKVLEQKLLDDYYKTGLLLNKSKSSNLSVTLDWKTLDLLFYYDESSKSCLRNKVTRGVRALENTEAGSYNRGYHNICVNKKYTSAHRVVYSICHKINLSDELVIDHIDGNKGNNRISNLRAVTQSENCRNKTHRNSNTYFQGITENTNKSRYSVQHRHGGKTIVSHFSYASKRKSKSPRRFETRELALEAAIAYRDTLVQQGLIVLT